MTEKVEEARKQALKLWKKTVVQMEKVSKQLIQTSGLERASKLLAERDKLFKRLGEETYRLIDQRRVKVPKTVQEIYLRIRDLMDRIIMQQKPRRKKATKKTTGRKTPAKRKTTRRKAA